MTLLVISLFCLSISGNNPRGMTCPLKQADCVWLRNAWNRNDGLSTKAVCLPIARVREEGKK